MSSEFIWPVEKYQQQIDPINQYKAQAAKFLSIQRGISVDEARWFVDSIVNETKGINFQDPEMTFFERDKNWVRTLKTGTLTGYLESAKENNEVIVPTLTTYMPEEEEASLVSKFMKRNAGRRGVLKKQAQVEELRGNLELAYQLNNQQDNAKRNNNSMSGVMAALGSIFENPTGHNTLTSITRCMSSFSNGLNERMISGNRFYCDPDMTLNNLVAVIETMDEEAINHCIEQYKLHIPTDDDIIKMIRRSSDKYWRDNRHIQYFREFASKLNPAERCAIVYTQDLYHLRVFNPEFMRNFIDDFAIHDTSIQIDDPVEYLDKADHLVTNYAHQVFISKLRGAKKERETWDKDTVLAVAQSAKTIENAIEKYKNYIDSFLTVPTIPCGTAYISHLARESVVLSDTDSTMFSVDDWVIWYFGKLRFDDFAFAVAGSIMFVSTQLIAHAMAILSANMNVARDKINVLAMKPEFVFPVFAQTPVAKHYFCSMSVKEGGVFPKNKYEIKGVHLKSSAVTALLVNDSQDRMKKILEDVEAGKGISEYAELERVADIERKIINSVRNGESTYLKKMFIKSDKSYSKGPTESPYRFYTLWNEVFGPSYSKVEAPPYVSLKLPLTTTSKKKMSTWLDSLADQGLANRFRAFLERNQKTEIKTIYISKDYIEAYGIPKEILAIVDIRKVVLDLTVTDRMILATIGHNPKLDTLVSELGY